MNAASVLRRVKTELAIALDLVLRDVRNDRARGQLEALRHMETVITTIENLEGGAMGWIGVDLDGVLAHWDPTHFPDIGAPITPMVERVKAWIAEGKDVRIFTARVALVPGLRNEDGQECDLLFAADQLTRIHLWCEQHLGCTLPVTAVKDFTMAELYDDRCVEMITNQGISLRDSMKKDLGELRDTLRSDDPISKAIRAV